MADDFTDRLRQLIREVVREELAIVTRPADPDPLLDLKAAAALASVMPETLRDWIAAGRLAAVRVGRRYRVRRADVMAAMTPITIAPRGESPEELAERAVRSMRARDRHARSSGR